MDQNLNQEQEAQQAVEQVMPKEKKPGRAAVQIFAIVVLLGLVGFGVYAWQNNRVAQLQDQVNDLKKDTPVAEVKKTVADPYAGWKTYTSTYQKLSFKYPADWAAVTTKGTDGNSDAITLTSPDGLSLNYTSYVDGIGGGCDPETCPDNYIHNLVQLPDAKSKNSVYIVHEASKEKNGTYYNSVGIVDAKHLGQVPKVGLVSSSSFPFYLIFEGKTHNVDVWLKASFIDGKPMDPDVFYAKESVKKAVLVMQSLSY